MILLSYNDQKTVPILRLQYRCTSTRLFAYYNIIIVDIACVLRADAIQAYIAFRPSTNIILYYIVHVCCFDRYCLVMAINYIQVGRSVGTPPLPFRFFSYLFIYIYELYYIYSHMYKYRYMHSYTENASRVKLTILRYLSIVHGLHIAV